MTPERAPVGARLRRLEHRKVEELRGQAGKAVGRHGGREHVAVEVRLSDGRRGLFWPGDLEEASPPRPWQRSLFEGS